MVAFLRINKVFQILLITFIIICEAKPEEKPVDSLNSTQIENNTKNNTITEIENTSNNDTTIIKANKHQYKNSTLDDIDNPFINKKLKYDCIMDNECSSFLDYTYDMAYCNKTEGQCSNYCFVNGNIKCFQDSDCNYSETNTKVCGSVCYRKDPSSIFGECKIMARRGKYCNERFIICEGDLVCDQLTQYCLTRSEASSNSGEPVFSLFLFMIIMLSLFNKQRSDEELLNSVSPNELLMITFPNRRQCPEEDALPLYQPVDSTDNTDEILEQNIPPTTTENSSTENVTSLEINPEQVLEMPVAGGEVVNSQETNDEGFTELPLQPPPSYDEAINYSDDNQEQPLLSNTTNNNTQ